MNDIQSNKNVEVTFGLATLSPLNQNLALSINSPTADPALTGTPRIIKIQNNGSDSANNVQMNTPFFPVGTMITNNTCTGALNAGATCDITITPGANASLDAQNSACTSIGTTPVSTTVTISADNVPSTQVNILVLGYGCIYEGGFLFSINDTTANTGSIGGKVAALTDELGPGSTFQWTTKAGPTNATSITNGHFNTR